MLLSHHYLSVVFQLQTTPEIEADLGAETYAAAWERGTQFDAETVARQLLAAWSS
jgi:hypothetical protein